MSKESKLAKKEMKAAKKAAKLEKSQSKAYEKLVKKIDKKNAKAEKKATKKGKPFVPTPIPTQEEAFAAQSGGKGKKIVLLVILLLLIWFLIYFIVMWFQYVAPPAKPGGDEETTSESSIAEYDRYENPHEITTSKDYSVADAKALLKQVIHDNWKDLGYRSDPSYGAINYTSNITDVNGSDCYVFRAAGKTFAVSVKLNAVYVLQGGQYQPLTFRGTDVIFD